MLHVDIIYLALGDRSMPPYKPDYGGLDKLCHNYVNMQHDYKLTYNIILVVCFKNKIISHVDIILLYVIIFMSHVGIDKSHVYLSMLHVDIIYLACRGQKYVPIPYISIKYTFLSAY